MDSKQLESVPTHEQTNNLPLETRQTLYNWHQSQAGDAMEAEYNAVLSRWNFNSLEYPSWAYRPLDRSCGVE